MIDILVNLAQSPLTPLVVLGGAFTVIVVEAWKASHSVLMGDLFADGIDE